MSVVDLLAENLRLKKELDAALVMDDETFVRLYGRAYNTHNLAHIAGVLSARLRHMDKRAKAANARADALAVENRALRQQLEASK